MAVDRRKDFLLRGVVEQFRPELERNGFHLVRRGSSSEHNWVQFRRPERDPNGHDGMLVLTMAHGRHERALLVDSYFVDSALNIETPTHKVLHRYDETCDWSRVMTELLGSMGNWPPDASRRAARRGTGAS